MSTNIAEPGIPAVTVTDGEGGQSYSVTLQILALMTLLTLLPAALMMMTSFTRIIIVLSILRQAIGVQSTPSNQVLIGLALFLTIFIMHPVFNNVSKVINARICRVLILVSLRYQTFGEAVFGSTARRSESIRITSGSIAIVRAIQRRCCCLLLLD